MNQSFLLGGLSPAFNASTDALRVFSFALQIQSHNIANISTRNFIPQKEFLTTGPNGHGAQLQAVLREAPNHGISAPFVEAQKMAHKSDVPSGTELAKELPRMISTSAGIEANVKTITVLDEMYGCLVNMKA